MRKVGEEGLFPGDHSYQSREELLFPEIIAIKAGKTASFDADQAFVPIFRLFPVCTVDSRQRGRA
jgi:hypothetical protein